MLLTEASIHDRKAAIEIFEDVYEIDVFADKSYINALWQKGLLENNRIEFFMPIKLKKGQKRLDSADSLFSNAVSAVSKVRQPIESFFNWLNELTNIQNAGKVRSTDGLISFVFARISLTCLVLFGLISI